MTHVRAVFRFLLTAVAFGVAIALGMELPWLLFGAYFDLGGLIIVGSLLGLIPAAALAVVRRKRQSRRPVLLKWAVVAFSIPALVILCLHFMRRPRSYEFLKDHAVVFKLQS